MEMITPVESRTVDALIDAFLTDPLSSFHKNRPCTKAYYRTILKRWSRAHGPVLIKDIRARTLRGWHQEFCGPDGSKKPMAHSMMGGLRTITGHGVIMLEWDECTALKVILSGMRFEMAKPRTSVLTTQQVILIIQLAHEHGLHSIALAQSLQHGCIIRQKDAIGEWIDENEPGIGYAFHKGKKWVRGVHWGEVGTDLTLRHVTSKRNKPIEIDFKLAPLIMREIGRLSNEQILRGGPIVFSEETDRPYQAQHYRKLWRMIADKAGVPKSVFSMDTRAGAITEALQLNARPMAVQKSATHSNLSTTQIYARGDANDMAEVLTIRAHQHQKLLGEAA